MAKDRYGDFLLTDAIRPGLTAGDFLREGYRLDAFRDVNADIPVLIIAASREKLFDLFMDLSALLPTDEAEVYLESMHGKFKKTSYREGIDTPVLRSMLYEHENMLQHDGCTSIAMLTSLDPVFELQFDDHKLLYLYATDAKGEHFTRAHQILDSYRIPFRKRMKFITESEHVHNSSDEYAEEFQQLSYELGADDSYPEDPYVSV